MKIGNERFLYKAAGPVVSAASVGVKDATCVTFCDIFIKTIKPHNDGILATNTYDSASSLSSYTIGDFASRAITYDALDHRVHDEVLIDTPPSPARSRHAYNTFDEGGVPVSTGITLDEAKKLYPY